MIFDIPDYLRLFIVFVPQVFLVGLFSFLIFKILKRNTNRSSLMLSGFYFIGNLGFSINGIAVIIAFYSPGEFITILYFLATYLTMFSFVFVLVFIISLLKLKYVFTLKKAFAIVIAFLHLYPGGVTYSENWVPIYSPSLFIAVNILFTLSFTIPVVYYAIRLRRLFIDANLKKKLSWFLIGITIQILLIYGVMLYNTWQDPIFKTVWGISAIVLLISSGLLIYYGIGRDL